MKHLVSIFFLFACVHSMGQGRADLVLDTNIRSVQLFLQGNQNSYPIITLGSTNVLELGFDDLGRNVRNFSYTYQLCNADWQPADLSSFDYLRGFSQNRISQYRISSIAKTNYVHYQVSLPERNCMPSQSGNYLVKVFLNSDTGQLVFTKRLLVTNNIVPVAISIRQPISPQVFNTHQKVQFVIDKSKLSILNMPQQLKVVVLQNFRWDNAAVNLQPSFIRDNTLEYSSEPDAVFPAGREFRWVDLRSFRFQSERIESADVRSIPAEIFLRPDPERMAQRFISYNDRNGFFEISSTDLVNPSWQGDYANVHFTFAPSGHQPFSSKNVYVSGQFTNYQLTDQYKMDYNAEKGVYEKTLFLKQGYYTYAYATTPLTGKLFPDFSFTEGNYWETENDYTILIYYQPLSGRHDELVGVATVNSRH
ncbi:MAG: hypothetical protein JWN76_3151 [Chitinophagaceae bacterium]|nr:hypothetical protein [Chitinophagaceae bacterium]